MNTPNLFHLPPTEKNKQIKILKRYKKFIYSLEWVKAIFEKLNEAEFIFKNY